MTIRKFRFKMKFTVLIFCKFLDQNMIRKMGDEVFLQYLDVHVNIPRELVDDYLEFTNFNVITMKDELEETYARVCQVNREIIKKCEDKFEYLTGEERRRYFTACSHLITANKIKQEALQKSSFEEMRKPVAIEMDGMRYTIADFQEETF